MFLETVRVVKQKKKKVFRRSSMVLDRIPASIFWLWKESTTKCTKGLTINLENFKKMVAVASDFKKILDLPKVVLIKTKIAYLHK